MIENHFSPVHSKHPPLAEPLPARSEPHMLAPMPARRSGPLSRGARARLDTAPCLQESVREGQLLGQGLAVISLNEGGADSRSCCQRDLLLSLRGEPLPGPEASSSPSDLQPPGGAAAGRQASLPPGWPSLHSYPLPSLERLGSCLWDQVIGHRTPSGCVLYKAHIGKVSIGLKQHETESRHVLSAGQRANRASLHKDTCPGGPAATLQAVRWRT